MDTLQDPCPAELADAWRRLTGGEIDTDALSALSASIRSWPTGRVAARGGPAGRTIVASWQHIAGSTYVTLRSSATR